MNKTQILLGILFLSHWLYGGDKLDNLDKKTEEFYKNISKIEISSTPQNQTIKNKKTTTKEKVVSTETSSGTKAPTETKETTQNIQKTTFNFTDENKKFQNLKISSIYTFNGKNYVVFVTQDIDGRYTQNDTILGYTIDTINTTTKTITLSKEQDKNTKYYLDISPEGISWKKNR